MLHFITDINPLEKMLNIFPMEWAPFSIHKFTEYVKTLSLGGWVIETEHDCFETLRVLEDLKLIEIKYDEHTYPIVIRRLVEL